MRARPSRSGRVRGATEVGVAGGGGGRDDLRGAVVVPTEDLHLPAGELASVVVPFADPSPITGLGEAAVRGRRDVIGVPDGGAAERLPAGPAVPQVQQLREPAVEPPPSGVAAHHDPSGTVAGGGREQPPPPTLRAGAADDLIGQPGRNGPVARDLGRGLVIRVREVSSGTVRLSSTGRSSATSCPVSLATAVSAMICPRERSSPWVFNVSVCRVSAANARTPSSTGRSAPNQVMVSGAGRRVTCRSPRA